MVRMLPSVVSLDYRHPVDIRLEGGGSLRGRAHFLRFPLEGTALFVQLDDGSHVVAVLPRGVHHVSAVKGEQVFYAAAERGIPRREWIAVRKGRASEVFRGTVHAVPKAQA